MHYSANRGLAIACRLSSKVIDFGTDRKRVYDFLFGLNSNLGPILPRFRDIRAFVRGKSLFQHPAPTRAKIPGCSRDVWVAKSEHPRLTYGEIIFEEFQSI